MTNQKKPQGAANGKARARKPGDRKTLSRVAELLRRKELDALNLRTFNGGEPHVVSGSGLYRCFSIEEDAPRLRLYRRDVIITREVVSAKRNAVVVLQLEPEGQEPAPVGGLWVKGGERVITLRSPFEGEDDFEQVILREEVTFVGVVIGYVRREWRRTYAPPVHVYKGGA